MFNLNNLEFRNLEEQVQKNKEDIARHYETDRALANFGIKVVGQVTTAEELPDPLSYTGTFGDAYAVGDKTAVDAGTATYVYYIYTRPDINAGQPNNYWLNVGKISIVGPQGPQGLTGPQGPQGFSTRWYYGISAPSGSAQYSAGDMYLQSNGLVYVFETQYRRWELFTNIKGPQGIQGVIGPQGLTGPQGPQGPKGETGDSGGFIHISGILANTDQLPTPISLRDLTVAYLVGASSPYDLYIQVGSTSAEALWQNVGPLNVATYVTSGGEFQSIWNADTKLTITNQAKILYGTDNSGNTYYYDASVLNPVETTLTFTADIFTEDTTISPFKYKATVTSQLFGNAGTVTLINDQPILLANYGINLGSVTPLGLVTIYTVKEPTEDITLTFKLEGGNING